METQTQILTETEAARYIGLSPGHLKNLRSRRNAPAPAFIKYGRAVRYTVQDLDNFIASRRRAGVSE